MKARNFLLLGLVLITMYMTGCAASGPAFKQISDLQEGKAVVYVYRPKAFAGSAITPGVTIGGTKMCSVGNGGYVVKMVDPGEVEVSAKTEVTKRVSLLLEPGQSGYVRMGISMGIMVGRPKLTIVDEDVGGGEIVACKKVCGD